MTSPAQHSLSFWRKAGYTCAITEHFNPFAKVRQDLFGFIDIICIKPDERGVIGIQTTSKNNMAARILKIKREPVAKTWLSAGNRIVVDGWQKNKKGFYDLTSYEVTLANVEIF